MGSTLRVDYDVVARLYDEPWRDHDVDPRLVAFLGRRAVRPPSLRILDIGCGTGKQLAANRRQFPDVRMIGLDRFEGMLRIARRRCPDATWVMGDGASLPFGDGTVDFVTCQFAYPHIGGTGDLLREAFRALRPGGWFIMTNIDPWAMTGWLLYQYFPEALALDRRDFMRTEDFAALMRQAGFTGVVSVREDRSHDERLADFLDFASVRHRASELMAIPDGAYAAGIERLEAAVAAAGDATARSEFVLVTIEGAKDATARPRVTR